MMNRSGKVLVVGLGSAHGDDQAGWLVAEQVLKKVSGTLEASENTAKPEAGEFQTPFSTNLEQSN